MESSGLRASSALHEVSALCVQVPRLEQVDAKAQTRGSDRCLGLMRKGGSEWNREVLSMASALRPALRIGAGCPVSYLIVDFKFCAFLVITSTSA